MRNRILIVGSVVVGQATGKVLADKGFEVTFTDTNPAVVAQLHEAGYEAFNVQELKKPGATVFMLSVPTYPLDLSEEELNSTDAASAGTDSLLEWCRNGTEYIKSASTSVGNWLSRTDEYCLVVIRSAVLPGTTDEIIIPILEKRSQKSAGRDFGICVNPEYLREHNALEDFANPWIIVIGELDKRSGDLLEETYYWADCPIHRVPVKEAEMQKFVHNLCNATKISFFNEARLICKRIGVDSERVFPLVAQSAESFWNPTYGTKDLGPFGGSCLLKDTFAFLSWAKELGVETPVLTAILEINQHISKMVKSNLR